MSIGLDGRRAIVGAVVGLVYGYILASLSFLALGAGHGTSVPFFMSSAPLGVLGFFGEFGFYAVLAGGAPAVWATFGALVVPCGRAKWRRLIQVLALLHSASGLTLIAATAQDYTWGHLERALRQAPEVIITWAALYLIGQGVLWWRTRQPTATDRLISLRVRWIVAGVCRQNVGPWC